MQNIKTSLRIASATIALGLGHTTEVSNKALETHQNIDNWSHNNPPRNQTKWRPCAQSSSWRDRLHTCNQKRTDDQKTPPHMMSKCQTSKQHKKNKATPTRVQKAISLVYSHQSLHKQQQIRQHCKQTCDEQVKHQQHMPTTIVHTIARCWLQ